jgi:L-arabinonolactonase
VDIEVVAVPPDHHGESPVWLDDSIVWVDVFEEPSIQQYQPIAGDFRSRAMSSPVASIAPRRGGGLVAATAGGFWLLGPEADSRVVADPTSAEPREMLNDSKCDSIGRLWCASMDRNLRQPLGRLHKLDPDYRCVEMDQGFITGNGLAFSPDGQRLYLADSRAEIVWVYDYQVATGIVSKRRPFFSHTGDDRPCRRRHGRQRWKLLVRPDRRLGGFGNKPETPLDRAYIASGRVPYDVHVRGTWS